MQSVRQRTRACNKKYVRLISDDAIQSLSHFALLLCFFSPLEDNKVDMAMKKEMGEKSVSLTDWNGRENNLSNHAALSSNSGRHIALLLVEAEVRDFLL